MTGIRAAAFSILAFFQASPTPPDVPAASPPPGWQLQTLAPAEYVHLVRVGPDGAKETLIATSTICDCQPDQGAAFFEAAIKKYDGTSFQRDSTVTCDESAQHVLVLGLAAQDNARTNFEIFLFRRRGALVTLAYYFRSAAPRPDAEKTLVALCSATT